jgi:hypothetical protein
MTKKVCVLFALLLVASFATSAMADSGTWIGGDPSDPTGWVDANNWVGGIRPYHYPDTITINNSSLTSSLVNDWAYPNPGMILDTYTGTFSVSSSSGNGISCAGANVAAGCTLNLTTGGSPGDTNNYPTDPMYVTYVVAPTGVVNLEPGMPMGMTLYLSGGGLLTTHKDENAPGATWSITGGSTLQIQSDDGYTIGSLTGDAASTITTNTPAGGCNLTIAGGANFSFAGTINYFVSAPLNQWGTHGAFTGASITGAHLNLQGSSNGGATWEVDHSQASQTYVDCLVTGDGTLAATNGNYGGGSVIPLIAQGTTFQPTPTNTTGSVNFSTNQPSNGAMFMTGGLQCAKDAGAKNTQFKFAVMGNGSANGGTLKVGTDYTQFDMYNGGSFGGINSVDNISTPSLANPLADADITITITRGLSTGVNSTNLGVVGTDPFAGKAITAMYIQGQDYPGWNPNTASTSFALPTALFQHIKVVGGTATVTVSDDGNSDGIVTLSNIFSNPTLAGDINNDGFVDVADYDIWAANVGKTGATWLQGDLNGDGLVDVADYDIWAANVGATSATPEPISMIILAIGGGLVAIKRRNG